MVDRMRLGTYPTPVEPAPRLARALGLDEGDLVVKRDDLLGLGGGGNKVRKLERTTAEALARGATTLVTTGAAQSNHARLTAAAGARLGLEVELVLAGSAPQPPAQVGGNLLLDHLLGARLLWAGDVDTPALERRAEERVAELGDAAYLVPYGGSNAAGARAYADAGLELLEQVPDAAHVVVAVGSGGTMAGLLAALGTARVLGVDTGATSDPETRVRRLADALGADLDGGLRLRRDQVGEGYSTLPQPVRDALVLAARTEGIVLDPVYTGRALAGLAAAAAEGDVRRGERTVLLHTGGLPGLFGSAAAPGFAAGTPAGRESPGEVCPLLSRCARPCHGRDRKGPEHVTVPGRGSDRQDEQAPPPDPAASGTSREAEALRESTERYRALFFDNPHATFSLDPAGRFQDANAVTVELSGFTLDVLRTMRFDEILLAEALPGAVAAFEGALGRRSQKLHTRIRNSTGEVMELNVALVPVVVDGEVVGLHGVAEDMTRENAMMRDLEEARRTAEDAAAAKTMFLANMSHEVRTPLTSVLGATELLADGELDAEQRHLVDVVHRSGKRLLLLVNDILDISRLEAGRLRLDPVELAVEEVVEDLRAWAEPLAVRRGLRLRCEVAPGLPRLVADPARLTQVLTNLVGNALKFTEEGEIVVLAAPATSELVAGAGAVPVVRLEVTDTGAGIPPELLESLFEPFSQLDSSQTRRHGGAGLGLAICRDLADLMGGRLEATSTPGAGSSFWVLLPAR